MNQIHNLQQKSINNQNQKYDLHDQIHTFIRQYAPLEIS